MWCSTFVLEVRNKIFPVKLLTSLILIAIDPCVHKSLFQLKSGEKFNALYSKLPSWSWWYYKLQSYWPSKALSNIKVPQNATLRFVCDFLSCMWAVSNSTRQCHMWFMFVRCTIRYHIKQLLTCPISQTSKRMKKKRYYAQHKVLTSYRIDICGINSHVYTKTVNNF